MKLINIVMYLFVISLCSTEIYASTIDSVLTKEKPIFATNLTGLHSPYFSSSLLASSKSTEESSFSPYRPLATLISILYKDTYLHTKETLHRLVSDFLCPVTNMLSCENHFFAQMRYSLEGISEYHFQFTFQKLNNNFKRELIYV